MTDHTNGHASPGEHRESATVYQLKISRKFEGDFTEDARGAIMQSQIEADTRSLIMEGENLALTHKGSGKSSLIITATDPADLDNLRNMADHRGYELPDHEEVVVPPVPRKSHQTGPTVLMHSPTEYLFGRTFRPQRPDSEINDHIGQSYQIVGYDLDLERDPALTFRILFSDGVELHVFPEEIDNTYHSVTMEAQ